MNIRLTLNEATRSQLINKSRNSDNYKDQSKGKNRWERRNKSHIVTSVQQYNKIDMNSFFKQDELVVGIEVIGETNNYTVTLKYYKVLQEIANQIKLNNNKLEFKCVIIALQKMFNADNVFIHCSCPDWKYRQAYYATKDGYNAGPAELRPSDITNPHDTKGGGCKHTNLVIGNINWVMKVASVINNYIHYTETHMERQYADIIFPKLYGMPYSKAVQLNIFDTGDDLADDEETIKLSNRYGKDRGKFKSGEIVNNQKINKLSNKPDPNKPLLKLNVANSAEKQEQEEENNEI